MTETTLHLLIVGPSGAGKTTYLTRLTSGHFVADYQPSAPEHPATRFPTNVGWVQFQFTTSNNLAEPLSPAQAVVVLFDPRTPEHWSEVQLWLQKASVELPLVPVAVCATHSDVVEPNYRAVWNQIIGRGFWFCTLSSKSNQQLGKPLEHLATQVLNQEVHF